MAHSPHVLTVTAQDFHDIVIEGSRERLVLVDFWADWCAPCRMLAPILTAIANEYSGKLLVAKVDTEREQALAAQFGIRSLPTVMLFKEGQPVDQFMGALPEPQIREFLERHATRESDGLLSEVRNLLDAGDLDGAAGLIAQVREAEPDNSQVRVVEAELEVAAGRIDRAREILDTLPLELADDPKVKGLKGRVVFARLREKAPPEEALVARLQSDARDSEARYQLAAQMVGRDDYEGALEQLLELVKQDRQFQEDAGRKGMLMVFDILGGEGDLVARFRSQMLSALY